LVAGASDDRTVWVWDSDRRNVVALLSGHQSAVTTVAFSPDSRRLLSGSQDSTIRLWDPENRKMIRSIEIGPRPQEVFQTRLVTSVAFAPDGRHAVSAHGTYLSRKQEFVPGTDNNIRLWDLETGQLLRQFRGHTMAVSSIAFSPCGRRILSASLDGTVRLWSAEQGTELHCFRGHTDSVWGVACSPDGRHALSGSADQTVRLWALPK
jgi:WD40 repeat protein